MDCSSIAINLENTERNHEENSNQSSSENLKKIPTSTSNRISSQMLSLLPHQQLSPPTSLGNRSSLNLAAAAAAAAAAVSHLPHHPNLSLLNSLSVSNMFSHHTNPLDLMNVGHHQHPHAHHHNNLSSQPTAANVAHPNSHQHPQHQHQHQHPHHLHPPRTYNSPPPISSNDPTANDCKLVDYRGQKVAAFIISGDTMLCLPQAFELFLKHLVGGLHTVYTKLKRLDIVPLVCNVEQVRILRGLGAIQPGVNRCKLLSCKDFDTLYRDCTTASSRPGRPPKRGPPISLNLSSHLQLKKSRLENGDYSFENGHLPDNLNRLEKSPLLANGYSHPQHLAHLPFLQIPHAPNATHSSLLSPTLSHNSHSNRNIDQSMLKNQALEAIARSGIWENCRAAYEDIVKHLERLRDEKTDNERASLIDEKIRDLSNNNVHSKKMQDNDTDSLTSSSPVLNLSKDCAVPLNDDHSEQSSISDLSKNEERIRKNGSNGNKNDNDNDDEAEDRSIGNHVNNDGEFEAEGESGAECIQFEASITPATADDHDADIENNADDEAEDSTTHDETSDCNDDKDLDEGLENHKKESNANEQTFNEHELDESDQKERVDDMDDEVDETSLAFNGNLPSSTDTLLRNIQGLLKLAADNARHQEQKIHYEKGTNSHMTYLLSLAQYYLYLAATHNSC